MALENHNYIKRFAHYILTERAEQSFTETNSLTEIFKENLILKTKLEEYKNLKKNLKALIRLQKTKGIQNEEIFSKIKQDLVSAMNEYQIAIPENKNSSELQQKLNELISKIRREISLTIIEFYHRSAWILWTHKKSPETAKKEAKCFLDSIWGDIISSQHKESTSSVFPFSISQFKIKIADINMRLHPSNMEEAFDLFQNHFKMIPGKPNSKTKSLEKEFYIYYLNFCEEILKSRLYGKEEKILARKYINAVFNAVKKRKNETNNLL
jgi:hypothetical protein